MRGGRAGEGGHEERRLEEGGEGEGGHEERRYKMREGGGESEVRRRAGIDGSAGEGAGRGLRVSAEVQRGGGGAARGQHLDLFTSTRPRPPSPGALLLQFPPHFTRCLSRTDTSPTHRLQPRQRTRAHEDRGV
eukprot:768639-Hanusia_phi.AAC.1